MANRQAEHIIVKVDAIHGSTEAAVRVTKDGKSEWVPLSQVHALHRDPDVPTIDVTPWIAKKKGWL